MGKYNSRNSLQLFLKTICFKLCFRKWRKMGYFNEIMTIKAHRPSSIT